MEKEGVEPQTGRRVVAGVSEPTEAEVQSKKAKEAKLAKKAEEVPKNWFARNKYWVIGGVLFAYVMAARLLKDQKEL